MRNFLRLATVCLALAGALALGACTTGDTLPDLTPEERAALAEARATAAVNFAVNRVASARQLGLIEIEGIAGASDGALFGVDTACAAMQLTMAFNSHANEAARAAAVAVLDGFCGAVSEEIRGRAVPPPVPRPESPPA